VLVLVGLLTVRAPQDASDREPDGR
jgi:hypothetical protein